MDSLILAPKAVGPEAEALGHEDDVVPSYEIEIPFQEGSVGPRTKNPFHEESTTLEAEMEALSASPKTTTLTVTVVELSGAIFQTIDGADPSFVFSCYYTR